MLKIGAHFQLASVLQDASHALCRRFARATIDARGRRGDTCNVESDLGILDLIQVFVEALDRSFENVCELDLIFHSDKCHYVLDEIIIGGLVLDTSITNIMGGADDQNKLHKSSLSLLTSGKKTQIGARPGTLSSGYQ